MLQHCSRCTSIMTYSWLFVCLHGRARAHIPDGSVPSDLTVTITITITITITMTITISVNVTITITITITI